MISFEEGYNTVINATEFIGSETMDFRNGLNRILTEDIYSDIDIPPFTRSAMDGYACRRADLNKELEVLEVIAAGSSPQKVVGAGQCSQIMTGAMLPEGADCVVKVEETGKTATGKISFVKKETKNNIRFKGEDIKAGGLSLQKGILLKPQHLAICATVGAVNIQVAKQPQVAVLVTGDEIVEPSVKPGSSQIRNSNAFQLIGQVQRCGGKPNYYGIIPDSKKATSEALEKALNENDIILFTGGVSMGEFDFVSEILKEAGIKILFQKMAVKPGKPTTFGIKGSKLIFGLPGNPVSSFIQFEIIVKPAIRKMLRAGKLIEEVQLPVSKNMIRKYTDRMAWFPVVINASGVAEPVEYHGSAHLNAFHIANGISYFPLGVTQLSEGELIHVRFI